MSFRTVLRHVLAALLAVGCAESRAGLVGETDGLPSFLDFPAGDNEVASAIALQADGKTVLAGSVYSGDRRIAAIGRLLPNGSPDPLFAAAGRREIDFGTGTNAGLSWVRVLPDGRILAIGSIIDEFGPTASILVVRLLANGEFDTTFDIDGRALLGSDINAFCDLSALGVTSFLGNCDAALLPDGSVIIAGTQLPTPEPMRAAQPRGGFLFFGEGVLLLKMRPNATLDPTFGTGGKRQYVTLPGNAAARVGGLGSEIERRPDGRLVLALSAGTDTSSALGIMQLQPNGAPDAGFGTGGGRLITFSGNEAVLPVGVQVLRDGAVALGLFGQLSGSPAFIAGRLLANGQPDVGFGSGGLAATNFALVGANSEDAATSLHVDAAGRMYVIGYAQTLPITGEMNIDIAIARFTPQGLADATFGVGGRRLYGFDISAGGGPFRVLLERGLASVVDGTGRLFVAAASEANDNGDAMMVQGIFTDDMFRDGFD